MTLFTTKPRYGYARPSMPKPKVGDGPWGEAIRYWMEVRKLSQADVVRSTKIQAKTVSRIVRGFHTQTRLLERIAVDALKVPLEVVLVSPERKLANEERRQLAREISEDVLRALDARGGTSIAAEPIQITDRFRQLDTEAQSILTNLLDQLESDREKRISKTSPAPKAKS